MEKPKRITNLIALLVLSILLTIFFFPVAIQQKTFITTGLIQSDLMNYNFPLKAAYGQALKKGKLLLWSDKISNGYPVFAEGQTGELYPFNLLFFKFLLPLQAYNYSLLLRYLLAAFWTYLFVRQVFRLSLPSGLLAGLTYSLSGFFMAHLVHPAMIQVASYLPLNFLLVEKILLTKKQKLASILGLALVFSLQALAGHHELLYFTLVTLGLYLLIRSFQIRKKRFLPFCLGASAQVLLAGLLALGLTAVQILPTLELIEHSTRKEGLPYRVATFYLFPLSHLLTFFQPQRFEFSETVDYTSQFPDAINLWETYAYLGLIPLFLAGTAAVLKITNLLKKNKKRNQIPAFSPLVLTFLILFVFSLLLALGRSTPVFKLLWLTIPGMKLFKYPTRFLVFTEFSLAVLAAVGFQSLIQLINLRIPNKRQSFKNNSLLMIQSLVLLVVFLDLFLINRPINPTTDPENWFQPPAAGLYLNDHLGDYRFHSPGANFFDYSLTENLGVQLDLKNLLPANFNLLFNLKSNDVLSGLLLSRHTQLNREVPEIKLSFDRKAQKAISTPVWIRVLSLQAVNYLLYPIPIDHPDLILEKTIPLKNNLNFNLYVAGKDGYQHERVPTKEIRIYKNKQSFPRVYIVPQFRVTTEKDKEILPLLSTSEINFQSQVLLEEQPSFETNSKKLKKETVEARAEITEAADDRVVINTQSQQPGFLVLADTFYPGWKAFIDDRPTKIYRANFAFRAIVLPPGDHQVVFAYQPVSFKIGALITLVTGGGLVLFLVFKPRIKLNFFKSVQKTRGEATF